MIDGVPDDVHQRVGQLLGDHLVQLRLLAAKDQLDVLPHFASDLPGRARDLRKDLTDRNHPDLDHRALQLLELSREVPGDLSKLISKGLIFQRDGADQSLQLCLLHEKLADDVHHVVQAADVHPHRLRDRPDGELLIGGIGRRLARRFGGPLLLYRGDLRFRGHGPDRVVIQHRAVEKAERDAASSTGVDGRQRGDDLARFVQRCREIAKPLVKVAEIKGDRNRQDLLPKAHVLQQAMLFVLGQRTLGLLIEREIGKGVFRRLGGLIGDDLPDPPLQSGKVDQALHLRIVNGEDQPVERVDGVVEKIDDHPVDVDLPHPQTVEHVLEAVRQLGDLLEAEHPRQTLERMHAAKDLVDQLGPDLAPLALELREIA